MSISLKTHKRLWGRAANRCAICRTELVTDISETDDESILGEACHIVAKSTDGPRGKSILTPEQRDKYDNLILLCNIHHKLIDDQPSAYSVDKLVEIKSTHEKWVIDSLGFDKKKQQDDEVYSSYVDYWANHMKLDDWTAWTSYLLGQGQPCLRDDIKIALEDIRPWLMSRVWPKRYPELEAAFSNFFQVVQDLYNVFNKRAVKIKDYGWETEKFYRNLKEWDPKRHVELLNEYEGHVALVQDLVLELTRAANYICDKVRNDLMSSYRINEGLILVTSGPNEMLNFTTYRVEYSAKEQTGCLYPGLQKFKTIRFQRDFYFGLPSDLEFC